MSPASQAECQLRDAAPPPGHAVSVVIPCLNEAGTVGPCVGKAFAAIGRIGVPGEVVVCDNGSTDDSVSRARQAGARVVRCPNRGYGNAIHWGVTAARGDLIVIGDADASYDFSSIERLIRPLLEGADLVMGNRFLGGILPGAMPWKNRYIGNPILTGVLNYLFHTPVGDAHCGLRSVTRAAYDRMRLECPGMEFASEMVVKATKLGLKIVEVPVVLHPDGRDHPPHLRPWRDGWRHLKFLLMFSPLHLFLIPGLSILALGMLLVWGLAGGPVRLIGFRLDIHWMVLGVLLVLIGVQVIQFGISARLYVVTHRFPEPDHLMDWFRARLTMEHGVTIGLLVFGIGLAIDGWILGGWIHSGFGTLARVRPALLATTLMALGLQIVFFAFFLGILGGRPEAPGSSPPDPASGGAVHPAPEERAPVVHGLESAMGRDQRRAANPPRAPTGGAKA